MMVGAAEEEEELRGDAEFRQRQLPTEGADADVRARPHYMQPLGYRLDTLVVLPYLASGGWSSLEGGSD